MKVLVYGTLKRDKGNNGRLRYAHFVREAIVDDFKLFQVGFPVAWPNEGTGITGEIWDIGNPEEDQLAKEILRGLDALEGYREHNRDSSMYLREPVITRCGEHVHMYVGNPKTWRRLEEECTFENGLYTWDYANRGW